MAARQDNGYDPEDDDWADEEWRDPWVERALEAEPEPESEPDPAPYVGPDTFSLRRQAMYTMGVVSSLGVQFVTVVGASVWLGSKADEHYNSSPWLTLLGLCVGLICAIVIVWRLSRILKGSKGSK